MRLRTILVVAGIVVLLPLAAAAIFIATFDAERYKPRIIAAVHDATGRELRLSGPIRLKPALAPTLSVEDAGLSNAPWGSRPEMATMRRLEVQVALLPLLSREVRISRLVLVDPDILLERRADGAANWQFSPPAPPAPTPSQAAPQAAPAPQAPQAAPAAPDPGRARQEIGVENLRLTGGRIALIDAVTGRREEIAIASLDAAIPAGAAPMRLDAQAGWRGRSLKLAFRGGSMARLLAPSPGAPPWPVDLSVESEGARLTAKGTLAEPLSARGYELALAGSVPDMARLAAFVPDTPLPPLREVVFSVLAADRGGSFPELRSLMLRVGESNLAALRPGLVLARVEVSGESGQQPLTLLLEARQDKAPIRLEGRTGPLAALLPGAPDAPWPLSLVASAGEARLRIEGALARPAEQAGLDARLTATIPDLALLSPLAGTSLPAISDIAASGRVSERARRNGFDMRELSVTAMGSDIAGEASILFAAQSRVSATLTSRKLDADALMAALPAGPAPGASPPGAPPAPPPPAPAPPADGRVIPDTELPLAGLRAIDAELQMAVGELVFGATQYRDFAVRLALASGHLVVPELRATSPSGALQAALDVDAAAAVPPVALRLRAPAMELATLLPPLGVPFPVQGRLELDVDVRGRGASPRAIAAGLDGHVGVAVGQGSIDNRLMEQVAGEVWRALVPGAPRGGATSFTCLAARFDIAAGQASVRTLLFDSALARVSGSGRIDLAQERLALRLSPTVRLAGGGISVPLLVGGSLARPSYRPDPAGLAGALGGIGGGAAAGAGQGAALGGPLGAIVGGVLGATRPGAESGGDCPAALAVARGHQAALPATPPAAATPEAPTPAPSPAPAAPAAPQHRSPIPGIPLPRLPFR